MDIRFIKISESSNTIKEVIVQDSSDQSYIKFVEILRSANAINDIELI
jgi:hypothetical protein